MEVSKAISAQIFFLVIFSFLILNSAVIGNCHLFAIESCENLLDLVMFKNYEFCLANLPFRLPVQVCTTSINCTGLY